MRRYLLDTSLLAALLLACPAAVALITPWMERHEAAKSCQLPERSQLSVPLLPTLLESSHRFLSQRLQLVFVTGGFFQRELDRDRALLDEQIDIVEAVHAAGQKRLISQAFDGDGLLGLFAPAVDRLGGKHPHFHGILTVGKRIVAPGGLAFLVGLRIALQLANDVFNFRMRQERTRIDVWWSCDHEGTPCDA